jgi:hypothetical protein
MEKKIVEVKVVDGCEIYALDGYKAGSPAVQVDYGFSTGSAGGLHGWTDSFAEAQFGMLDENMGFVPDVYTSKNSPNRACIGRPREIEGWDPDDGDDVDWESYAAWVADYCRRVL